MRTIKSTLTVTAAAAALAIVFTVAPAVAQTCHPNDTYIDGSLCVGIDCVCGAGGFGFDTIKLQENNLRIKFNDTSSSASFPNNDWQLTANDSSNGGANHFSIDDVTNGKTPFRVQGNAPSWALLVEASTGDIGLGTSTPVVELHIKDGDSPTLRLEQDGSSGFTAQTWDIAGNETNFFVRDVTGGSRLPFKIKPGAPDNSIFIAADGNVGLGTASPDAASDLEIVDNGVVRISFDNTMAGVEWVFQNVNTGDFRISDVGDAVSEFDLDIAGNLTITGDYFSATCTAPGSPCAPDYVFEPDYELMPIAELGSFVRENRHLPNVPSEDELRNAGRINNSRFQMTLLEKIEELTLYTLAQQEEIAELRATVERLAAER